MKITLLNITVSTDNNRDDNNKRNIRRMSRMRRKKLTTRTDKYIETIYPRNNSTEAMINLGKFNFSSLRRCN